MQVWEMKFADTNKKVKVVAPKTKLSFEKKVSTWVEGTVQESYKGTEVWRLTTESKGQYYVLYFIASPAILRQNEKNITKILDSFVIVKPK
jgi:hypothetical protein